MRDKFIEIETLLSADFDDKTLDLLFKTNSLNLSLICAELKIAGKNCKTIHEVKKIVKTKNWMYKYFWDDKQKEEFRETVKQIYKNIYVYSGATLDSLVDWFFIMYGISNISVKKNIQQYILCN